MRDIENSIETEDQVLFQVGQTSIHLRISIN